MLLSLLLPSVMGPGLAGEQRLAWPQGQREDEVEDYLASEVMAASDTC